MIETSNNPFGNVLYEVNADSTSLSSSFFKLAVKQYEALDKARLINGKDSFYLDPIRMKTDECYISQLKENTIEVRIVVSNNEVAIIGASNINVSKRNLLSKILYDGCLEHDYIVWQSFEKEVLDKLDIKYKKDWGHLLRNWYARWFFKNQLYIIGVAILLFKLYDYVKNRRKKKLISQ